MDSSIDKESLEELVKDFHVDNQHGESVDDENETKRGKNDRLCGNILQKMRPQRRQNVHIVGMSLRQPKKNGTSALSNHLKNHCKLSPFYKQVDKKKQSTLNFKPSSSGEGVNLTSHKFSQEKCRKFLTRFCIKDNRPFSVVDDEGLREWVWELNPMFKFLSRWTVTRDSLLIYEEEKNKLKNLLRDQTISFTSDTWTSIQNINYMSLTAHWVDDDWILRKFFLNFCPIANHRGESIRKLIYRCLQEWGIERVFTITLDNASPNTKAITYLKKMLKGPHSVLDCKYIHLRCNAHIINLVVKDGLAKQNDSISRIRNAVRYVRSSPSRTQSFKECVEKEMIDCKRKPCLDVETRWNSTFLMLETALKFETAFDRLKEMDNDYAKYFSCEKNESDDDDDNDEEEHPVTSNTTTKKGKRGGKDLGAPGQQDWENARVFVEFLRIFFNATKKISGSKYVTASSLFYELCTLYENISKLTLSCDESKQKMGSLMNKKFEKYWGNLDDTNLLITVALVLDPRNKLPYLGFSLSLIHGKKTDKIKKIKKKVEDTIRELYDHYKKKIEKVNERKGKSTSTLVDDNEVDLDDRYLVYLAEEGIEGVDVCEVDVYLRDGTEKKIKGDDTFDILGWWKLNSGKFPVLSQIAKHVFAIPISSVAFESAFSTGGRVIDKYRSSLTPKNAEALICTQDWLRSTPTDLQDSEMHGEQLEAIVDNLETLEQDMKTKKKGSTKMAINIEDDEF